jgi:hypothetical protein
MPRGLHRHPAFYHACQLIASVTGGNELKYLNEERRDITDDEVLGNFLRPDPRVLGMDASHYETAV